MVTDAVVNRLLVENGRCTGIEYRDASGRQVTARAADEVVLAAGGIGSPHLLMVSGIGPAAHLRASGVDVVLDLPAVGSNLSDHPLTGVIYKASREVPAARNNHGEVVGVLRTTADSGAPDLQLIFVDSAVVVGLDVPDTYLIGVCPHSAAQPWHSPAGRARRGYATAGGPELPSRRTGYADHARGIPHRA